jgi:hypothetical protein
MIKTLRQKQMGAIKMSGSMVENAMKGSSRKFAMSLDSFFGKNLTTTLPESLCSDCELLHAFKFHTLLNQGVKRPTPVCVAGWPEANTSDLWITVATSPTNTRAQ